MGKRRKGKKNGKRILREKDKEGANNFNVKYTPLSSAPDVVYHFTAKFGVTF